MTPSNEPTKATDDQFLPSMSCSRCNKPLPTHGPYYMACQCASAPLPGVTMGGEVRVTKEMVERALVAYHGIDWPDAFDEREHHYEQEEMRAALSAALSLAAKPQSAEVREVSEGDVERALTAYDPEIDWPKYRRNFHVEHAYFTGKMRAALVAYERGRKA